MRPNHASLDSSVQLYSVFVAHVFEEVHEAERGVEFMTTTREDWRGSSYEVHITWHLALYYLGKHTFIVSIALSAGSPMEVGPGYRVGSHFTLIFID